MADDWPLSEIFKYLSKRHNIQRNDMSGLSIDFDAVGMIFIRPNLIVSRVRFHETCGNPDRHQQLTADMRTEAAIEEALAYAPEHLCDAARGAIHTLIQEARGGVPGGPCPTVPPTAPDDVPAAGGTDA